MALSSAWMAPAGAFEQIELPRRVDWMLYTSNPSNCRVPPPAERTVACGNYGTFFFGTDPGNAVDCHVKAQGSIDQPIGYNLPATEIASDHYYAVDRPLGRKDGQSSQTNGFGNSNGLGNTDDPGNLLLPPPPPPAGFPCQDQSCLSAPGGHDGQQPWMMILDWEQGPLARHGLMVSAIASQVWRGPVALFGVDRDRPVDLLGSGVSDAHLIYSLCEVNNLVDEGALPAPISLSMSLGRYDQASDANDLTCDKHTLDCQLARVIQRLHNKGTIPFAAAGNYREKEFPGDLAGVHEVGNLDMAQFQASMAIKPTWETPLDSALLMPGYGVCIEYPYNGERLLYPTPGGSSFSGVSAASMISRAMLDYELRDPAGLDWTPKWLQDAAGGDGCFVFGDFSPPYCNPVIDRMIQRMTNFPLPKCWSPDISRTVLDLNMPAVPPQRHLTEGKPGLSECLANHLPAPTSDLCIPCGMDQGKSKAQQLDKIVDRPIDSRNDLIVDLSGATPAEPGAETHPVSIHLRIDDDFYLLLGTEDREKLDQLANAEFETLVVRNAFAFVHQATQPSLVTFYSQPGSSESCWNSEPVVLMGHQIDRPMFP